MAGNWLRTRGWIFDPSDNDILDFLEDYVTGRASPPQATFNFADLYGDVVHPSVLFDRAVGDPSNSNVKYFVTTKKEKVSASSSGFSWKKDSEPIGIINEATGENRGFKKGVKMFQKDYQTGKDSDDLLWIMTEYSLNSNTPGVEEDFKNEVICRVRRIPINKPKAQAQQQQEAQVQQQQEEEDEADIDLQLKL